MSIDDLASRTRDEAQLTRAEREAERSRRRALREPSLQASRVTARVRNARTGKRASSAPRISKIIPKVQRPRAAADRQYARRAFVQVRYANAKKAGQWRAHGLYLEREGAQREGEKGVGFDAESNDVSLSSRADGWQTSGDPRMFKMILSPEDGDRLDLQGYTRRFMSRFEEQAGQPLEWMAIQHNNTDNTHVHVLVRGKGLVLSPELIGKHARTIAEDEATRELGYRSEKEIQRSREREVEKRRFTGIDRDIQRRAVPEPAKEEGREPSGAWLVTEPVGTSSPRERGDRKLRVSRLQSLEKIGVSERVGHLTWRLDPGWDKALRELDKLQSRSTMLMQHRELMTDHRILPQVTKLKENERLTGRVLGTGLDDGSQSPYLLIEGTDGRAHFLQQSPKIEEKRAEGELQPGRLISIEAKPWKGKPGRTLTEITDHGIEIPARGFSKAEIPQQVLDADLKHREAQGISMPTPPTTAGFAGHYQRSLIERKRERERERQKERDVEIE